ncbi:MAG: hypothetical protein NZ902_06130 [Acidilobaceae archaeon]|nr:hypothetical protein [Acidilobaceae archaeon]MDW7974786.1 TAXI family TRAP transporter solute-binding subunit [Sulfolobales archaeon]
MRKASLTPSHIAGVLLLLAVIIVGAFLIFSGPSQESGRTPTPQSPEPQPPTPIPTENTPLPSPPRPVKQNWVLLTATRGTIPYAVHSTLAGLLNDTLREYLALTVQSVGAGAVESTTSWDEGIGDLALTSLNIVYQYSMEVEAWALKAPKRSNEMSVIIYQFPVIYTVFVTEDLAERVKCWRDVGTVGGKGGEGVYVPPPGTGPHPVFRRVFSTLLGVRSTDLEQHLNLHYFPFARLPDELAAGRVKIIWGAGDVTGPAPWLASALARVGYKMVAVPPCADELERLKLHSDLTLLSLDLTPYNVKTRDGKTVIELTVSTPMGLLGSTKLSKEHVYQFVKAHFANCRAIEEAVGGMRGFCAWGLELNLRAFKTQSVYGAKVHPGTALAFKELGYDLERMGILVARE